VLDLDPKKDYLAINDKKLYYAEIGTGFPTIVLLGWASDLDTFPYQFALELSKNYLKRTRLIFLHLSNFSKSSLSSRPYFLNDYALELNEACSLLKLSQFNLIGHSAGGRISAYYAINFPTALNKLVLMNSAGLNHPAASNRMLEQAHFYFSRNRSDIDKPEILRETLRNIYDTDLTQELKLINVPTLIIWGGMDNVINISKAQIFKEQINNSQLMIYPKLGHLTTFDPVVFQHLLSFLNETPNKI
jgi:pimeloyl-ACP methyl ester carboxylesterase